MTTDPHVTHFTHFIRQARIQCRKYRCAWWSVSMVLLLLLPWRAESAAVRAESIRICIDDVPHPPYTYPDRDGDLQRAVREIARAHGWRVDFVPRPLLRCRHYARLGLTDAYFGLTHMESDQPTFRFPQRDGAVDPSKSIATATTLLFKRAGSPVRWDGTRLANARRPLLFSTGLLLPGKKARALGAQVDQGSRSSDTNLRKLIEQRGDAAILFDYEGTELIKEEPFAGKVVRDGPPFTQAPVYLAFSTLFYAQHSAAVEAIWLDIQRMRLHALRSVPRQLDSGRVAHVAP